MLSSRQSVAKMHNPGGAASIAAQTTWPVLICLLGDFRLLNKGNPVPLRGNGKTETLLCMLALEHPSPVSREALVNALWPQADPALATQSLNSLVHSLKKSVSAAIGGVAPVIHAAGYYQLNIDGGVGVDIECFDVLASESDRQTRAGNLSAGIASCIEALHLYRGDLTGGVDTDTVIERERLRARCVNLLARLTDFHYAEGDFDACLDCATRLLKFDPGYEEAHRAVMRCYMKRGARSQAIRQYQVCRDILRAEFETEPEQATRDLFEQIRRDPEGV